MNLSGSIGYQFRFGFAGSVQIILITRNTIKYDSFGIYVGFGFNLVDRIQFGFWDLVYLPTPTRLLAIVVLQYFQRFQLGKVRLQISLLETTDQNNNHTLICDLDSLDAEDPPKTSIAEKMISGSTKVSKSQPEVDSEFAETPPSKYVQIARGMMMLTASFLLRLIIRIMLLKWMMTEKILQHYLAHVKTNSILRAI